MITNKVLVTENKYIFPIKICCIIWDKGPI